MFAYCCSTSAFKNKKLSPQTFHFLRIPRNVSYEQHNKVYISLQYGITEWLVEIQNTGTLTGEKLKKTFCSLKLTRLPDEFVIFDARPQDFIFVSDDLTIANMDPCQLTVEMKLSHKRYGPQKLSYSY